MRLNRLLLVGLCALTTALAAAAPALALDVPKPGRADPRIKWVDYDPLQVYRIVGAIRTATQIVFASDETIVHVAVGDSVAWEVAADKNILFLKPREHHPPTNLIVTTERAGEGQSETRNYNFELEIRTGSISAHTPRPISRSGSATRRTMPRGRALRR